VSFDDTSRRPFTRSSHSERSFLRALTLTYLRAQPRGTRYETADGNAEDAHSLPYADTGEFVFLQLAPVMLPSLEIISSDIIFWALWPSGVPKFGTSSVVT
jgi:hypothetical protein